MAERVDTRATATPSEGSLDPVSVPQLLAEAWQERRSGWLLLSHAKDERRIRVLDGAPTEFDSGRSEDTFAQRLEDAGRISPADRLKVERLATERECPQASAVLALKLLDVKSLYQAMRLDTRRQIAETFEWRAGAYRWIPAEGEPGNAKPYDVLTLIQEQLPRRWGTERLFEALMATADFRGEIAPRFRRIAQKLAHAGEPARRAISRLDAGVPLGQILGECAGDPLAAATLWTLHHAGVLRATDAKTTSARKLDPLEIEIEIETLQTEVCGNSPLGKSADRSAVSDKAEARKQALRAEIESFIVRISELDHYAALGVTSEASPAEIKKTYFKAAKNYHPDALARIGLDDLHESAAQVFGRIAEAFETLSDPHKRAAYDAGGSQEPEIDTARLAQAETSFRKGEILVRMGNFEGALEYLKPAVELWPEEPAYQAGLGWAYYKQPKKDPESAHRHLEIAHSQNPQDAVVLFRLGIVLRSLGQSSEGEQMIAQARSLQPDIDA